MSKLMRSAMIGAAACAIAATPLAAQQAEPENLVPDDALPTETASDTELSAPATERADPVGNLLSAQQVVQGDEVATPDPNVQIWSGDNAVALLSVIAGISAEGLKPTDYSPADLRRAIDAGEGAELNVIASRLFSYLVEDMRDGRTPMSGRRQWFVFDPDADRYPTGAIMARALASGDFAGALQSVAPEHPDYAKLRTALAETSPDNATRRAQIRANMDRWRWLPRDLGSQYLMTNVPEFQLRLTVNDNIISTYRTIVGKPGRTATPQLAEMVEGVIFNPTWTVPQSIVKGEGLGARVLGNPAWARRNGYRATRGSNGWVTVVQQPGPGNSLGAMKLDMPNRHAIFLHDTPSRHLFNRTTRALSHGCIRTERASELAITLAILRAGMSGEDGVQTLASGKYTKVGFDRQMPVYITYFTMGTDIEGNLTTFNDLYGRDAPVLRAFEAPREANRSRVTGEQIIPIEDDLRDV